MKLLIDLLPLVRRTGSIFENEFSSLSTSSKCSTSICLPRLYVPHTEALPKLFLVGKHLQPRDLLRIGFQLA
jgi:hypothetical protein